MLYSLLTMKKESSSEIEVETDPEKIRAEIEKGRAWAKQNLPGKPVSKSEAYAQCQRLKELRMSQKNSDATGSK